MCRHLNAKKTVFVRKKRWHYSVFKGYVTQGDIKGDIKGGFTDGFK